MLVVCEQCKNFEYSFHSWSATRKMVSLKYRFSFSNNLETLKKWLWLTLNERKKITFLNILQGVGAVFVGVFLAAYLAGLPTTAVYHSDPIVRTLLSVVGVLLLVFILTSLVLSLLAKRRA